MEGVGLRDRVPLFGGSQAFVDIWKQPRRLEQGRRVVTVGSHRPTGCHVLALSLSFRCGLVRQLCICRTGLAGCDNQPFGCQDRPIPTSLPNCKLRHVARRQASSCCQHFLSTAVAGRVAEKPVNTGCESVRMVCIDETHMRHEQQIAKNRSPHQHE